MSKSGAKSKRKAIERNDIINQEFDQVSESAASASESLEIDSDVSSSQLSAIVFDLIRKNKTHQFEELFSGPHRHLLTKDVVDAADEFDKYTPLMWAAKLGNIDMVRILCGCSEISIDKPGGWNQAAAIHVATTRGNTDVVKVLLEHKALVNQKNKAGLTALMLACELGHLSIVKLLLAYDADCKLQDKDEYTALILAVINLNKSIVKLLIENDPTPEHLNIKNKYGKTALFMAVEKNDLDSLKALHEKGADVDAVSKRGLTPIMMSCLMEKRETIFNYLIKFCHLSLTVNKHTVLTKACGSNNSTVEMINSLTKRFLQTTQEERKEGIISIALSSACHSKNKDRIEIVKTLLKESTLVDLDYQDPESLDTAIIKACSQGEIELLHLLVKALEEKKGNVKRHLFIQTNKEGHTALSVLAHFFKCNQNHLTAFIENAASLNGERPYLLEMLPFILPKVSSPITVMNKCKENIAIALCKLEGRAADVNLVAALVNITVALTLAAAANSLEARDLLAMASEFEDALVETVNSPSMDYTENLTAVLYSGTDYARLTDVSTRARAVWDGPLHSCVHHHLTKILSTPQVASFVHNVFYNSLKRHSSSPIREVLDVFQTRSDCATNRYKPLIMFLLELLERVVLLVPLAFCVVSKSAETCEDKWSHNAFMSNLCQYYTFCEYFICLMLLGRVLYEVGEIVSRSSRLRSTGSLYENIIVLSSQLLSDVWNVLDLLTIVSLCLWAMDMQTGNEWAAVAVITLCLGLLRYLSLFRQTGQLVILIFEMSKDLLSFALVFSICIAGFGVAFHCLFPESEHFLTAQDTFLTLFDAALGDHDFSIFSGEDEQVGIYLMCVYIVLITMVLLNLIVARMSATHEKIDATSLDVWSRVQAVNAQEFLLLHERNAMCMLPAPFNLLSIVTWLVFDRLMHFKVSAEHLAAYSVPKSMENSYLYSVSGSMSDLVVSFLTIPMFCILELWCALQELWALKSDHKNSIMIYAVITLPVWVVAYFPLIALSIWQCDWTIKSNDSSEKILFSGHRIESFKPSARTLNAVIFLSWFVLEYLAFKIHEFGPIVAFNITMLALVGVNVSSTTEYLINKYYPRREDEPQKDLLQKSRLKLYSTVPIGCFLGHSLISFIGMVVWLRTDYQHTRLVCELIELAVFGCFFAKTDCIHNFLARHFFGIVMPIKDEDIVEMHHLPLHHSPLSLSKRSGDISSGNESCSSGNIVINLIRGDFLCTGKTVFGTKTNPFVVVTYFNQSSGQHDVQYSATAPVNLMYSSKFGFDLRASDLSVGIEVYDRVSDFQHRYLCGRVFDMREWIANRRFEDEIKLNDKDGNLVDDFVQVSVTVKFPPRTQMQESSSGVGTRSAKKAVAVQVSEEASSPAIPRIERIDSSDGGFTSCPTPREVDTAKKDCPSELFTREDRNRIFDKLINKSDRDLLLKLLPMKE